jgi:hypothetical protein
MELAATINSSAEGRLGSMPRGNVVAALLLTARWRRAPQPARRCCALAYFACASRRRAQERPGRLGAAAIRACSSPSVPDQPSAGRPRAPPESPNARGSREAPFQHGPSRSKPRPREAVAGSLRQARVECLDRSLPLRFHSQIYTRSRIASGGLPRSFGSRPNRTLVAGTLDGGCHYYCNSNKEERP